jgi:Mlc titration factor MtfA (ptsG expression regulator)
VRLERDSDRWFAPATGLLLLGAGTVLGALVGAAPGAAVGGAVGVAGAFAIWRSLGGRSARRRALLATPFPPRWRDFLFDNYDHYDRLPADLRRRFEDDVRIFMSETRVTGIEAKVTDELRLLVAASAVTLSVGWPDYEWDQVTEVLLYPHNFDRDYSFEASELAGQAHPWGTVILSIPALRQSFADPDDAYHVGIHEFAHLLEMEQTRFDGIPPGLSPARSQEWVELMDKEMDRMRRGKSVIDDYGASDPVEFLAVAVEAFFESALELRRRHREVYEVLAEYFRQDPAAWDDARGLKP